jgi:hypothetical protein
MISQLNYRKKSRYINICSIHLIIPCIIFTHVRKIKVLFLIPWGSGVAQSLVSDNGLDDRGSTPGRGKRISPLASVSRPALGPTQPPVQRVPGVLSPGLKRGRGVTLTTHLHLVPRSRMSRSYTPPPVSP